MIPHSPGYDTVALISTDRAAETLAWNPHATFAGVVLRHLVTGSDTGGRLSLHHVRIDPGCVIGDHTHLGMVEIHEVLKGDGTCTVGTKEIRYVPGKLGVMPADTLHQVVAGDCGMLLLATFSPALL
jgi:quercetin dioxygenase-like cupin family protein